MTGQYPAVEERLARLLAATDYLVDGETADDAWWNSRLPKFRDDYLRYAREILGIVKGPTLAAQAITNLGAEIRALAAERDRYRDCWLNARRRVVKARQP